VSMTSRWSLAISVSVLYAGTIAWTAQSKPLHAIVTSPAGRAGYLGHAVMWTDPGVISPIDLRNGPPDLFPYTFDEATAETGIGCAFDKPGKELGGKSAKFTCLAPGDHKLRLKYWDREHESGNREAFAMVAATRLMWALGFVAVPALPMNVQCQDCPEDPHTGSGPRALRRYVAMWQLSVSGPPIVSGTDDDQGWKWQELDDAINKLPPGEERKRQRAVFDALALFGVLVQHGDRKAEQQALWCMDDVDLTAGEVRAEGKNGGHRVLVEHAGASACRRAAAAIVDAGATFGGAGKTSNGTTAKMHLESWRKKQVFEGGGDLCHGDLSISMAADGGEGHPVISEEGRLFLLEQLHRLTADHVRAIFEAARVDRIHKPGSHEQTAETVDAWVAAFQDKVRQIETRHCRPAS
jgi:hypothetical protein